LEVLKEHLDNLKDGYVLNMPFAYRKEEGIQYAGQPVLVSEYGGIALSPTAERFSAQNECVANTGAWGYSRARDGDELAGQYIVLTREILSRKEVCGYCWTQLYDVEQEHNGLFTFERTSKLSAENEGRLRALQSGKRAGETGGE
jgi:hypothetical protein